MFSQLEEKKEVKSELEILCQLKHENIVQVLGCSNINQNFAIV